MGESTSPPSKSQQRTVTLVFSIIAALLVLRILGITIWHGSGSPFNTFPGKAAFTGLFVGGPVYVFIRISKPAGMVMIALSVILWTAGLPFLIDLVRMLTAD